MTGQGPGQLRVLHVVVAAGPTNSQWNERCLPAVHLRRFNVCSLLPTTVAGHPPMGAGLGVADRVTFTGLPVVSSDIAPHREIVPDADAGQLVPVGDVDALAGAIGRVRDLGPSGRAVLGTRARQLVTAGSSLESMHRGYEQVYTRVSGRTPAMVREDA